MTSAVGGGRGSPKSRQKERGCMNYVCDKGYMEAPKVNTYERNIAKKMFEADKE